ncbi:MAG: hypothetical protein V1673_01600 [Candidatus Omnitrophota bacterium]
MKDLLDANIFSGFPSWKSITFAGEVAAKILKFEVMAEGEDPRPLYLASIISKDEKMAWQSFQDVLEHMMTPAQNNMRGFFGFDVLSVDIQNGIRNFDPKALSRLITNHARDLGPDQKALIRYGQLFALLHYRAPADWGKIEVKTHVEFFSQEPASSLSTDVTEASVREALTGGPNTNQSKRSGDWGRPNYHSGKGMQSLGGGTKKKSSGGQLDLFIKKLLSESGKEPNAIYIVHDLSVHSVWDSAHESQQQRMHAWLEKEKQSRQGTLPEIYYCHAGKHIPVKA